VKKEQGIWIAGFIWVLAVGFFNQGIIALDDYSEGFARFIPAQNLTFQQNLDTTGIRLPFQSIFLLALSKLALFLGLASPTHQARFVLMVLGAIVFTIQTFCAVRFFEDRNKKLLALLLSSFYFLLPLLYTRPLIENMSGAFVTLAAFFLFSFHKTSKARWIWASVMSLSLASLFRFQTGVCLLALGIGVSLWGNRRTWWTLGASSFFAFLITGLLDLFLTGGFHRSLRTYFEYNLHHASSYGTTPFYTFFLLFIALSLPPAFLGRYQHFDWKNQYRTLLAPLLFWGVFLLAHSIIPHKEERFIIPVLPLFLVCLVPLAHYWIADRKDRWRVIYFLTLNLLLLPFASFSTPQTNVIALVRYLDDNPKIKTIVNYKNAVVLFPKAFASREFKVMPFPVAFDPFSISTDFGCDSVKVVTEAIYQAEFSAKKPLAIFSPGPLEALLVKLNPRQNARRGRLVLLEEKFCD